MYIYFKNYRYNRDSTILQLRGDVTLTFVVSIILQVRDIANARSADHVLVS